MAILCKKCYIEPCFWFPVSGQYGILPSPELERVLPIHRKKLQRATVLRHLPLTLEAKGETFMDCPSTLPHSRCVRTAQISSKPIANNTEQGSRNGFLAFITTHVVMVTKNRRGGTGTTGLVSANWIHAQTFILVIQYPHKFPSRDIFPSVYFFPLKRPCPFLAVDSAYV